MTGFAWLAAPSLALLLLTWVLYPLAMALLARLRRRPAPAPDAAAPAVTVVLATREPAVVIAERVRDLLAADYPADRLSVVVAVDARATAVSADVAHDVAAIVQGDPRVRVVAGDAPGGKAAALNAGVRAATGERLVFTDTHQRFARDTIAQLAAALADPRLGAVSGSLRLPGDVAGAAATPVERYWRYERWLRRNEAAVHSTIGVTGAVYAMPRRCWRPLPADVILDDLYGPMRLVLDGHRVGFTERARAVDMRRTEPGQEYHRKVRTLTGVVQLCAWLPAVLVPVRNPVWAQFVCHKLLRLLTPYLALAFIVGVAGLLAARADGVVLLTVGGAAAAAVLLVATLRPVLRRRLRDLTVWGLSMQAAVVMATVNGLRGRWDVWRS